MDVTPRTTVQALLDRATAAVDAAQAINFAQAACNAANALRVLKDVESSTNGN